MPTNDGPARAPRTIPVAISFFLLVTVLAAPAWALPCPCTCPADVTCPSECSTCLVQQVTNCDCETSCAGEACPEGSTQIGIDFCDIGGILNRCRKTCVLHTTQCAACAPNRYGAACAPCPGGTVTPCSDHGTCNDGIFGDGACVCEAGFTGSTCETPVTTTSSTTPTTTTSTSLPPACSDGTADPGEECGEPGLLLCAAGQLCVECRCRVRGDCQVGGGVDVFDVLTQIDLMLGRLTPTPTQMVVCSNDCDPDIDLFDALIGIDVVLGRTNLPLVCP